MVLVPVAMPETTPVGVTVATPVAVELHTPPVTASLKVVVEPAQTIPEPESVPGLAKGLTVTVVVARQPEPVSA